MRLKDVCKYIVLVPVLVFTLFPFYWNTLTALKQLKDQRVSPPVMWTTDWRWANFSEALLQWRGLDGLVDSAVVTAGATLVSVVFGTMAGYALARFRLGGQQISFFILSMLFMPPVAVILPHFLMWKALNLVDRHIALIVTYTAFNLPFATWIMKGFFEELPPQPEEAALVFGASRWRAFREIVLPQVRPGLVVTTLFCVFFAWNEFIYAVILGRRNVTTLPFIIPTLMEGHDVKWGHIGAIATIATIPMVLLTFALQRYLIRGMSFGVVRETR